MRCTQCLNFSKKTLPPRKYVFFFLKGGGGETESTSINVWPIVPMNVEESAE
jgi:hypothetical protein